MILTKTLEVKVNRNNLEHYRNLGYEIEKMHTNIIIPIEHLTYGSKYKILVRCDNCCNEKDVMYKTYNFMTNNQSKKYYCQKCVIIKRTKTCVKKYGVENPFQSEEIKEKIKETNLEKYGVEIAMHSEIVKNNLKQSNLEKYGVENPFQSERIKEKIKKYWLENYGVESYTQTEECKNKQKLTTLKKYGTEYYQQSKLAKNNRIENGYQVSDDKLSEYEIYKRKVRNKTRRIKKELFKNWNGYDYYDNEYIKENLKLNNKDKNYPTIDHKISLFYGFKNNISIDEICDIDNLCITKRWINSKKNTDNNINI